MSSSTNITDLVSTINHGDIEFGTPKLSDKIDMGLLEDNIAQGNIIKTSPVDGLVNYKYSPAAAARRAWNDATVRTRGLVVDDQTGTIVARGFNKFFNLGEVQDFGVDVDLDSQGLIMDKMDGSLGLAYKVGNSWRVSTAGSLRSDQAIHATRVMNDRYGDTDYTPGKTMLVEIIYPDNRIVTDYGDKDDLVLLGGADTNGHWVSPDDFSYNGPRVEQRRGSIRDVLNTADPEDGSEGFVIRLDSGLMVKVKYPKYLELHRAKFNFSAKKVWEALKDGSFAEMLAMLPDEFHDEAKGIRDTIMADRNDLLDSVDRFGAMIPDGDRASRARWVTENAPGADIRSMAMRKYVADRDIGDMSWAYVKPGRN